MQSGKDPDYATGKTKRNGTGKPGTQTGNPNRHANETNPRLSVRNTTGTGRPGTQPANQERNRQTRNAAGQPGTEPEQNTTE